ncbi:transmembrane protein, putative (macronuclear) [Tetrahymena thermophila SB210]|uniref:Transmembrane protein, putative n=1 Tax=Tetrahymena thermophila (strain SB210) TaxID=312017 RepID=I7M1T0_TETTS|nr:transmembrane protein, putative [Tetrahymena thermophila SB210]EAR97517.2 transmembrane protein, putative [Tetrahymena thermophila SB210]|eukprot:XP_001017762.2 transmembrane protein, putative [Tetrahymena thermophila SB210]
MNKYTLQFVNKSLEEQYFNKVAFPFYNTIFSAWCKVLLLISLPCSLFTYFTGNLQYLGFIWCIVTSSSSLLIVRYYKNSFNIVTAVYNAGFVVLNIGFILITNKNIGAQGQQNNMMFIFAGSQYMFHFILSIGSNFLLTSAVIFFQNFSYSAVFFPGQLNSFHGLLFFSMCFLIWMKYTNEKYQREVFILQENEKEWSQFVRDVLPSSVIMVKYDTANDQIQNKLVNRVAQTDYDIKDDQSLTQFLRNTTIQKDSLNNNQSTTSVTRISVLKNSNQTKNKRFSFQNGFSDTLERFIYYRFKTMIQKSTILKSNNRSQTPTTKLFNISEENSQQIDQSNTLQPNDLKQAKDSCNLTGVNFTCSRQKDYSPTDQSNNNKENDGLNFQKLNKRQSFFNKSPNSKSNKEKKEIKQKQQEKEEEDQQKKEKYNVEEFKAFIMKNNVKQEVLVKIVFYYTSQPVCSISIDEGLKQQVVNISRQSKIKENLYLEHFLRIAQKFQSVISCKNPVLFQAFSFLHLNHLRNLQDLISLKQDLKLKAKYIPFQFNNLLKYISSIFSPIFSSEGIQFSILIGQQKNKQNECLSPNQQDFLQFPSDIISGKLNLFSCSNINEKQNNSELPKKSLILSENQNPITNDSGYNKFEDFKGVIETYNDQQRINQVIINLLENALEFLKKSKPTQKYVQLKIDLIQGSDEQSNLIQIKVINSTELNYSKQELFLVKDSLRVERDLNNPNYLWQSQTSLKPTQLGLKVNQKILDKTSPYNYMDINCYEEQVEFSFFIYQNSSILLQKTQFTNKIFDQIRNNQIEQSYMPSSNNFNPQLQQYQDADQSTIACVMEQKMQQQVSSVVQILQQSVQQDQNPNSNIYDESSQNNFQQHFSHLDCSQEQNSQISNIVLKFQPKQMLDLNKKQQAKKIGQNE